MRITVYKINIVLLCCIFGFISCLGNNDKKPQENDKVELTIGTLRFDEETEDSKNVKVMAVINEMEKEFLVPENTKSLSIGYMHRNITDIRGLDQLKKIKFLRLQIINSRFSKVEDILYQLPDVEMLYIFNCSLDDLGFIRNFKKLKFLVIDSTWIMKSSVIDFSINKYLEYFSFIYSDLPPNIFEGNGRYLKQDHLIIKNIPEKLKIMNFGMTKSIIYDDAFFSSLKGVKKIYITNELYTKEFWANTDQKGLLEFHHYYQNTNYPDMHANVIIVKDEKDAEVDLPKFLTRDNIINLDIPSIY